jgi:hypothetical protein
VRGGTAGRRGGSGVAMATCDQQAAVMCPNQRQVMANPMATAQVLLRLRALHFSTTNAPSSGRNVWQGEMFRSWTETLKFVANTYFPRTASSF